MKIYLIAYLAYLALLGEPVQCQEAAHVEAPVGEVSVGESPVEVSGAPMAMDQEVVEVSDAQDIDVARMIGDLLEFNYVEGQKGPFRREERDLQDDVRIGENMQPVNDQNIILKYNDFMDAFFTRLSVAMRANHDPMRLVIRSSGKIDAEENPQKNKGNKNKFGGKRNNLEERNKRNRHPKDVGLNDVELDVSLDAAKKPAENGEAKLKRRRREVPTKVPSKVSSKVPSKADEKMDEYDEEYYYDDEIPEDNELEGRALDEEYDMLYDEYYDDEDYEDEKYELEEGKTTREGRKLSPKAAEGEINSIPEGEIIPDDEVEGRQRRRRVRRRRVGGRRRRTKCGKFCQRRRRRLRRRRLRNRRRGKRSIIEAPSAVISGISNMRRVGNVRIFEGTESQDIAAEFNMGPITLKAQKLYGKGSKVDVREALATASSVKGEVVVSVTSDGTARVKRLQLLRPDSIQVSGTLRKKENLSSDKAMQGLVRRTRPVVARKMRQTANKIFRSTRNQEIANN